MFAFFVVAEFPPNGSGWHCDEDIIRCTAICSEDGG